MISLWFINIPFSTSYNVFNDQICCANVLVVTMTQNAEEGSKSFSTSEAVQQTVHVLCCWWLHTPSAATTRQIKWFIFLYFFCPLTFNWRIMDLCRNHFINLFNTGEIDCLDCILPLGGSVCWLTGAKWKTFLNFHKSMTEKNKHFAPWWQIYSVNTRG